MTYRRFIRVPLILAALICLPWASSAQPAGSRRGVEFAARYSHAAESDLGSHDGGGAVAVHSWRLGLNSSAPLSAETRLLFGAEWSRHELDLGGSPWLPERLQSVAAPVGVSHRWNESWRLLLTLQPRFANAGTELASDGFDLPVLAFARYTASPELTWLFGLRYSTRSDVKLLPLVGATWQFAPKWEAALAFPESGVSYRASDTLTLRGVAAFHGGDYRLHADPRTPPERIGGSLADAWLEYRELRAGLAAEYALTATATVRLDVGAVIDQRFDYFERGVEVKGSSAPYVGVALLGRF